MSVIGITHKQPRVFAHDAIALEDLPGCLYRGIVSIDTQAQNNGAGFEAGESYQALSTGAAGTVITVTVNAVDGTGGITAVTVENTNCQSTNLLSLIHI